MLGDDEEVEEHVILRLPDELAARMHENIEHGTWDNFEYEASETVEDAYTVFLSVDGEEGIQTYPARLVELPCIIEAVEKLAAEMDGAQDILGAATQHVVLPRCEDRISPLRGDFLQAKTFRCQIDCSAQPTHRSGQRSDDLL